MAYLARPVANRGVHLRITPRPSNLGETREILRLLSQFGEIDYFKNLKYDGQGLGLPNIGLVIYKDEQGAKNCFRGSPVRFRMGKVKAGNRAQAEVKDVVEEPKQEEIGSKGGAWGLGESPAKKGPLGAPFGLGIETPHQRRYLSTTSSSLPPNPQPVQSACPSTRPHPPTPQLSNTQKKTASSKSAPRLRTAISGTRSTWAPSTAPSRSIVRWSGRRIWPRGCRCWG